jgi:hypothetical protein
MKKKKYYLLYYMVLVSSFFLANQHHILKVGLWREYLAVVMLLESHYTLWQGTRTKMR